jgi:putative FmdB family regulatory protein
MPIYEYICNDCNKEFEILTLSSRSKEQVVCPECGGSRVKKLLSAGAIRSQSNSSLGTEGPGCGGGSGFS